MNDGVWSEKANSDYLLPKQDLGRIVAEPALNFLHKHGAKIHLETRVSHLNHHIDGRIEINGEVFDAVILAVAPYHVDALLPEDTPDYIQTAINRFTTMRLLRFICVMPKQSNCLHL